MSFNHFKHGLVAQSGGASVLYDHFRYSKRAGGPEFKSPRAHFLFLNKFKYNLVI